MQQLSYHWSISGSPDFIFLVLLCTTVFVDAASTLHHILLQLLYRCYLMHHDADSITLKT